MEKIIFHPVSYIVWHYFHAPGELLKIWWNFIKFFGYHLFPIHILLKTLLSPWKRDVAKFQNRGSSPDILFQNFVYGLLSRFVGFLVRFTVIILAIIVEIFVLGLGLSVFVFWLLWPFIVAFSLFTSNLVLVFSSLAIGIAFVYAYIMAREKPADEMELQEIFNEKWSSSIWERINILKEEVPKEVIKNIDENLVSFLKEKDIKKEDFEAALVWEVATKKAEYVRKRFWLPENLFSITGFGRDWVYGFTPLIDRYTEKINALQKYEDLIGRRSELEQIERILSKGGQANVLVIGEPGVGKMSLVQKFARLVHSGKTMSNLAFRRTIFLNLKRALSGLKTIGELEERLITIFGQAQTAGDVILIIDNFHHLVSASDDIGLGKKDISQILVPFLEKANFQLIAIATYQGLHRQIEKQADILKFFEKVEVKEPAKEMTIKICQDSTREIEQRTPVKLTVQAIKTAVDKADIYITDVPFPEKALDLLEDTAIYVATKTQDYLVKPQHIDAVISQQTEIPVGTLEKSEKEKLLNLEELIHKRIINQETAVSEIASAMRRGRTQIAEKKRPIGSFLFLGPTGVGKTETAKALAHIYFGSEKRMNRFDMSEFQGPAAVDKMIGTNSGKPGMLTTVIKENPFSLLLLDEIEKADYGVLNLFLQILEEGWVTDANGRKVNFRNQIIIATSNAGANFIRKKAKDGQTGQENEEKIHDELIDLVINKNIFRPEFVNRFDGVVMFKPLTHEHLLKISKLMLDKLKKRLAKKDLIFKFDEDLIEKVARLGYDPANGARPMRRVIQKKIEDQIAKKLLKGEIEEKKSFKINANQI